MTNINKNTVNYNDDEFDLVKLVKSLKNQKWLIFILTIFFTLLVTLYTNSLKPVFRVQASFISPNDISMYQINQYGLSLQKLSKEKVFGAFLDKVLSTSFQISVFNNNGYFSKINTGDNPINDLENHIRDFTQSIELASPNDDILVYEPRHTVVMEGSDPFLMSSFLNDLIAAANQDTISKFIVSIEQLILFELDKLELINEEMLDIGRVQRLNEIAILIEAANTARAMGIIDNNFTTISTTGEETFELALSFQDANELPEWYLYGEKALLERIRLLKNRDDDTPFITGIHEINQKILEMRSREKPSGDIDAMQLTDAPYSSDISKSKKIIVLLGFLIGFIASVLLALIRETFKLSKS